MKKLTLLVFIVVNAALLCGCAQNVSPNTYTTGEVGVVSRVKPGVIIAKRVIDIDNNSGMGGPAGLAGGAVAGSMIGASSSTSTHVLGAVGGAVVGGVVGHVVDKAVNHHTGYEYIIKLNDGQTVSVVQEKSVQLAIKQHVLVIYGAMTRVVPDNAV
ncbi:MAG: hypothetical protein WCH10_06740 [bacterium]